MITKFSFTSQCIYNMYETGVTNVSGNWRNISSKKLKRVGSSTEQKKTITIIFVPPMFIHPLKRQSSQLEINGLLDTVYEQSNNSWTNEDLFIKWFQHFVKTAKPRQLVYYY